MIQLLLSLLLIIIHILIFGVFGSGLGKLLKLSLRGPEAIFVGFFGYYAIMQLVFLPSMLLRVSFSWFVMLWGIVLSVLLLLIVIYCNKQIWLDTQETFRDLQVKPRYLMVLFAFIVVAFAIYQGLVNEHGYDAAFYIGTITTTLFTDTMFAFHGETGWPEPVIDMRYALSGVFYMNTAFWCRILSLPPLMVQKFTFGAIGVILHGLFVYMIGLKLFGSDASKKLAYWFAIVAMLLNGFFVTSFTSSGFLLWRGFEAKSYCANVVFIGLFYLFLCLWKNSEMNKYWKILFIVALGSVPVTMSSIVILPAMVFIFTVAESIAKKDKKLLLKGGISLVPNGIYLVAFYLFLRGVWLVNL